MGMSTSRKRWTAEEIDTLPADGFRYEVIDGEQIVTPGPSLLHQDAVVQLTVLLLPYCNALGLHLSTAPADVKFGTYDQVQPDLFVMPRTTSGRRPLRFSDVGHLLLAVEVLSPSSRQTDRREKRKLYQAQGVPEYWVVDTDDRAVERWTPSSAKAIVVRDVIEWQPVAERDAISIDLAEYFRVVCDA